MYSQMWFTLEYFLFMHNVAFAHWKFATFSWKILTSKENDLFKAEYIISEDINKNVIYNLRTLNGVFESKLKFYQIHLRIYEFQICF